MQFRPVCFFLGERMKQNILQTITIGNNTDLILLTNLD